jgi:hypothetical protein
MGTYPSIIMNRPIKGFPLRLVTVLLFSTLVTGCQSSGISTPAPSTPTPTLPRPTSPPPTDTTQPTPQGTQEGAICTDSARLTSRQTEPENGVILPGETFTVTWVVQNNGTCPWTPNYRLALVQGDPMGAAPAIPITEIVPPGEDVTFSLSFTPPEGTGTYGNGWQLEKDGASRFGELLDARVDVAGPVVDLKQELFVSFGGDGDLDICGDFYAQGLVGDDLPTIIGLYQFADTAILCLFGFPADTTLTLELITPEGEPAGLETVEVIREVSGVPFASVGVGWPAGLPQGEWTAVASADDFNFNGPFQMQATNPRISRQRESIGDLFKDYGKASDYNQTISENLDVVGIDYPSNVNLPLGLYRFTGLRDEFLQEQAELVHVENVLTDETGRFTVRLPLPEERFPPGRYCLLATNDPDLPSGYYYIADEVLCFILE